MQTGPQKPSNMAKVDTCTNHQADSREYGAVGGEHMEMTQTMKAQV